MRKEGVKMFPEYDSKHIFDEIERGVRLFGSDKKTQKLEICLGGYALHRANDGAFWGSSDGLAYSLFIKKEFAEIVKANLETLYPDQLWDIIYVGGIWLDKEPVRP